MLTEEEPQGHADGNEEKIPCKDERRRQTMKIGFFDSGIGGLTVLKEALKQLPDENYIYFADTVNVPYGTKPKEEVKGYIIEAADFIAAQGVKALVIACNTATSVAIGELRSRYAFPIIGMEPAVKPAVERSKEKRVLVTATPLTLKEEKFQNLVSRIDIDNIVDVLPLPELVGFAEQFVFDGNIILPYLKEKLADFTMEQYGTVVLGCTHFPLFKKLIRKVVRADIHIIDGSMGTVKRLKDLLEETGTLSSGREGGNVEYYSSGQKEPCPERFERYLKLLEDEM